MADNILLNPGTGGATVGTDDISGVHYQIVKNAYGVDGEVIPVSSTTPMPVSINNVSANTYIIPINRLINTALVANTTRFQISIEHSAASTKTIRIRKIHLGALNTTAVAGDLRVFIDYGTAASTGGTVITPQTTSGTQPAAEAVAKTLPTIVAATTKLVSFIGSAAATANTAIIGQTVYERLPGSREEPLLLRAGVLESLVIGIQSFAANVYHVTGYIIFTED